MNTPAARNPDHADGVPAGSGKRVFQFSGDGDDSLALAFALQALVRGLGHELDVDDVAAALGLPFITSAVLGEEDLACWPLHARDAFLVETARLFGMGLRAVHPPSAARGLERTLEFGQHFDASYRPLIQRALEHGQAVLAWRGWPGDRRGLWGIICDTCGGGIGFCGYTMTQSGGLRAGGPLVLESPPVQLYVVETVEVVNPEPDELVAVALERARGGLGRELAKGFGVVTGPAAYDAWIARLIYGECGGAASPSLAGGHARMAAALVSGRKSAIRFLTRWSDRIAPGRRRLAAELIDSCHDSVTALSGSTDPVSVADILRTAAGRAQLADQVAAARAAATKEKRRQDNFCAGW